MSEFITHSREETVALGAQVAQHLAPGALIAFTGGLGAGKTAFCEGIARGLGCTDPVSSPTFAIVNYYRGPRPFAHFDLYRISTENDLCAAGFYDYLDEGAVVAAEWSENFADLLALEDPIHINIERVDDTTRRITIEGAVDTAGKTVGVALLQDDRLLYECYLDAGMTHSETLMPLIDNCLKLCGMGCKDIDLYGVNAGPGSFTGLRIGLAAVKGLAFPRETLCAPVSTLEALAAAHTGCGTVLCALDARRAQVYSAAFDLETHERLMDDDARAVADLAEFVENCKKPLFFVGDGAALCYNKYGNVPGVLCVPPALRNGRAAAVAYVAKQMAQRGEAVLPEALLPDYHRLSQAERERAERLAAEAARTEIPEDTAKGKDQHQ